MTAVQVIQRIVQNSLASAQLADIAVGTVTGTNPLSVSVNPAMDDIRSASLYLTAGVVPREISATDSRGGTCSIACTENGETLPSGTISEALSEGDKVLLLRVESGQSFVVLSRLYGGG